MRVLYGSAGESSPSGWSEAVPEEWHPLPAHGGLIRVEYGKDLPKSIRLNDKPVPLPKKQEWVEVECPVAEAGVTVLTVEAVRGPEATFVFQRDPHLRCDPSLLACLVDFETRIKRLAAENGGITRDVLERGVNSGDIPLLVQRDPLNGLSLAFLEQIERSLGSLQAVCARPRVHLRVEEDVRPIGVVRRTGPAALRHIASHSEHWEARTVGGLRPARLLAQVLEDEVELYENRMVRTLIDRLALYTTSLWRGIEDARWEIDNALDWNELGRDCSDYRRGRMLSVLIPDFDAERLLSKREAFLEYERRVRDVRRVLARCLATRFYQTLRRAAAVHSPVKATNILLMDPHYHSLYVLWDALDRDLRKQDKPDADPLPVRVEPAYASYAAVLLLVGLNLAGFRPVADADHKVISLSGQGDLIFEACYARHDWTVRVRAGMDANATLVLHFDRGQITRVDIPADLPAPTSFPKELLHIVSRDGRQLKFAEKPNPSEVALLAKIPFVGSGGNKSDKEEAHKHSRNWGLFINNISASIVARETHTVCLAPLLTGLGDTPSRIDKVSAALLSGEYGSARDGVERPQVQSAAAVHTTVGAARLVVLLPVSPRTLPSETAPLVLRRLATQGDNFAPQDAARWGDYRRGALPVSPWQINSLLRLVRLVNTNTLGMDVSAGRRLNECPVCESSSGIRLRPGTGSDYSCQCGAEWNTTQCPACGHKFGFIRPALHPTRGNKRGAGLSYGYWIETLENECGENAICGFCESPSADVMRHPICPACGVCPRRTNFNDCLRCRSADGVAEA